MTQPAELTISVDADGDGAGAAADEVWSNFDRLGNRSIYHSVVHTPVVRDMLTLYRTLPKPTTNFYGVQKSAVKLMPARIRTLRRNFIRSQFQQTILG